MQAIENALYPIVCDINGYVSNYVLVILLIAVGLWSFVGSTTILLSTALSSNCLFRRILTRQPFSPPLTIARMWTD